MPHVLSWLTVPACLLHSKNECVEINFGAKPFKFDLEVRGVEVGRAGSWRAGIHMEVWR